MHCSLRRRRRLAHSAAPGPRGLGSAAAVRRQGRRTPSQRTPSALERAQGGVRREQSLAPGEEPTRRRPYEAVDAARGRVRRRSERRRRGCAAGKGGCGRDGDAARLSWSWCEKMRKFICARKSINYEGRGRGVRRVAGTTREGGVARARRTHVPSSSSSKQARTRLPSAARAATHRAAETTAAQGTAATTASLRRVDPDAVAFAPPGLKSIAAAVRRTPRVLRSVGPRR